MSDYFTNKLNRLNLEKPRLMADYGEELNVQTAFSHHCVELM